MLSFGFSPVFKSVFKINGIGSTDSFQIQVFPIVAVFRLRWLPVDWKRVCRSVVEALPPAPCRLQKTMLTAPSDVWAQKSTAPLFRRGCGPTCCYPIAPGKHAGLIVVSDPFHPMGFFLFISFLYFVTSNRSARVCFPVSHLPGTGVSFPSADSEQEYISAQKYFALDCSVAVIGCLGSSSPSVSFHSRLPPSSLSQSLCS